MNEKSKEEVKLTVTMEHLIQSIKEMNPSVTQSEVDKHINLLVVTFDLQTVQPCY